jgi:hypothetical protein
MHAIIIFQGPDYNQVYHVPECPEWLLACDGHIINGYGGFEVAEALNRLSDALCDENVPDKSLSNPDDPYARKWGKYLVNSTKPVKVEGDLVVIQTGWE